jgi:hypothetical protein
MYFYNLEHIKNYFDIRTEEPEEVRRELKKRLKNAHPDRRHADSDDGGARSEEVLRLLEALRFVDDRKKNAGLVPVETVSSLVKEIKELAVTDNRKKELEQYLSELVEHKIAQTHSSGLVFRIALTAVAGFLTIVWVFPSIAGDNPVLRKLIDVESAVFNIVWLALLAYTGATWLMFRLWHDRRAAALKDLKLETTQHRVFERFLQEVSEYSPRDAGLTFYKDQLEDYIQGDIAAVPLAASFMWGRPRGIDPELAQKAADLIVMKAEQKGLIKKMPAQSLRERYAVLVPVR